MIDEECKEAAARPDVLLIACNPRYFLPCGGVLHTDHGPKLEVTARGRALRGADQGLNEAVGNWAIFILPDAPVPKEARKFRIFEPRRVTKTLPPRVAKSLAEHAQIMVEPDEPATSPTNKAP